MESTCSRCHQTVQPEDCFCPFCGLPQLVYTADGSAAPGQPERVGEPVRDAGTVDWKPALRLALMLAIPAGALCSMYSPAGNPRTAVDGRSRRLGGCALHARPPSRLDHHWSRRAHRPCHRHSRRMDRGLHHGISLYAMRFWLHQGPAIDDAWNIPDQSLHPAPGVLGR